MTKPSPAEQIALWADQLRDISALGLHFASNIYDETHFHQVQDIAMAMLALAHDMDVEDLEPLRGPIFSRPSPSVGVDAAIIDDEGRILLIQRADNKLWAMPGGMAEVGETAAETAVREALEESGVPCRTVGLLGIWDNRICGAISGQHLYNLAFLCIPLSEPEVIPSHLNETLGKCWYTEDTLPELSPGHAVRIKQAFVYWRGARAAYFDPAG